MKRKPERSRAVMDARKRFVILERRKGRALRSLSDYFGYTKPARARQIEAVAICGIVAGKFPDLAPLTPREQKIHANILRNAERWETVRQEDEWQWFHSRLELRASFAILC